MASSASNATTTAGPQLPGVVDESVAKKVALAALVGTALEWYDFFLFTTAAALVFNAQYFVSQDPFVSAMSSFATLAVGFVARPIGGFIFGALGDKVGRKKILMVTIVGIGLVTGLIGLLPNYMTIGVAAPILLVALRILQGLAVGGEWSGAVIIAVENAPVAKRARYAALPQLGSPIGTILSSGGFFGMLYLVGQSQLRRLGLAHPVHRGDPAAGHLDVDPQQAQRIPGIRSPHGVRRDRARPHPRRPDEELAPDPGGHVLRAAGHRRLLPHHQLRGLLRHQGAQDALRNPAARLAPRRRRSKSSP